jgi:hypothetical protein
MFLDSILSLPGQLLGTISSVATLPLQLINTLGSTVTNTVSAVAQPVAGVANNLVNTAGSTVQNVTSSFMDILGSPLFLIGGAVVLIILLKK